MRPLHVIVGTIVLVVLPIASATLGSGYFAWTMYSGAGEYRVDIRVKDAAGRWRSVAPTGLAESSSAATADVLVGADHFRRGPSLAVFRTHLSELAAYACRARRGVEADVVLTERVDERSPERVTSAHADCR
jgi:hypothetical protein